MSRAPQTTAEDQDVLRSPDFTAYHSYADYLRYRTEGFYELIKGYLVKMPAPLDPHQVVVGELLALARLHVKRSGCLARVAPYDVRLFAGEPESQTTVVQPDVCIICDRSKIDRRGCNGAPDLVIEVLSPSTAERDRTTKVALYEEAGVPEYWIVDTELRRLEVRTFAERSLTGTQLYDLPVLHYAGEVVRSFAVEGFTVDIDEVFAELLDYGDEE